MSDLKLPRLDYDMPIVIVTLRRRDPATGQIVTEELEGIAGAAFQRWWQSAVIETEDGSELAGDKVTQTNIAWVPPAISNPPTQAQVEYIRDKLGAVIFALRE